MTIILREAFFYAIKPGRRNQQMKSTGTCQKTRTCIPARGASTRLQLENRELQATDL